MSDQMKPETLGAVLDRLAATIEARKGASPDASYTASLLAGGAKKCAGKFAEESGELVEAAGMAPGPESTKALIHEAGDVLYHLFALLAACGVRPEAVAAGLAAREGQSGHEEKAARGQ